MTDDELTGLARQALNMAGKAYEQTDYGGMVLASCHEGEGIHRMASSYLKRDWGGAGWTTSGRKTSALACCARW